MIVKSFDIKKSIEINNIFLIYGENEGLKDDLIKNFSLNVSKESIFKYSEKDILINLDNFYNNVFSQSFFDKNKLILVERVSDKLTNEIEKILDKNLTDIKLVFTSGILEKKSKLRKLFEKEKKLICVPVYKDDNKTLFSLASSFFKTKGINISSESINVLIDRSSEDRKNLKNELSKIENYIGIRKKIELNEILQLSNLAENYSINKIVDLSLAKNTNQTIKVLNENIFSTEDTIIIIRSFLSKAKRLRKLKEEYERNKNIDQTITSFKPPIFWKDKEIVKKQMQIWSTESLEKLIYYINKIELQLKKNTSSSLNIIRNFIIEQASKSNNKIL